jgi:phospholipase C
MKRHNEKRKFELHRSIGWAVLGLAPWIVSSPLLAQSAGSAPDRPVVSAPFPSTTGRLPIDVIEHIVVIYLENRSFDNLFGFFPGANGLNNAGATATQVDANNVPYATLPPVIYPEKKTVDERFPKDLPNRPFLIEKFVGQDQLAYMIPASFYDQQRQVNGGRMDKFALYSPSGGLIMGYHDISKLGLWQLAKDYTLADNYFKGAFGGSFMSHFWISCVCIPRLENPPPQSMAQFALNGVMLKDGNITPDGYILDDMEPQTLHQPGRDPQGLLPGQFMPTIGDRLSDRGVSWAWYSEGFNDAVAGHAPKTFKFRHQAYAYFARYAIGTADQVAHLKDEADLFRDISAGRLPSVVFYKPTDANAAHPTHSDLRAADAHLMGIISALQKSDAWKKTAIIITFDDNGGYWDHVPPPRFDRWGPGLRVPAIVVSPFARRNYVDHTFYELTSILKLIETRFRLEPLGERDAKASPMLNVFDFAAEGQ